MKTKLEKFQSLKLGIMLGTAKDIRYLDRNGDISLLKFTPEDLAEYTITNNEIKTHQVSLNKNDGVVTLSRHYVIREQTIEVVFYSSSPFVGRQGLIYQRVVL